MTDIDTAKVRRLDMTLLLVFAETLRLRKLTLVAQRMGLTQPAISHSLARLREIFGDPLFLRRPHGLEPTARARELERHVSAILHLAQSALAGPEAFDPASAKRDFRIAALDQLASLLGAPLCKLFESEAPAMSLTFRPDARAAALELLERGELDLALGAIAPPSASFASATLYRETYAVAARRDHPSFDGTLPHFLAARHILVSISGDRSGVVDTALKAQGLRRQVAAVFPLFLPALATVAETDMIATVPKRLAEANAQRFGLTLHDPPVPLRPFSVNAVWHRRNASDGAIAWLVSKLRDATAPPAA